MCERYNDRLPLARPQLGPWPATQASALIEQATFQFAGWRSVHRATAARAQSDILQCPFHTQAGRAEVS